MFYHDRAGLGETSNREYERAVVREGEQQVPFDSPSPIGSGSLRAGSHFLRNDKGFGLNG